MLIYFFRLSFHISQGSFFPHLNMGVIAAIGAWALGDLPSASGSFSDLSLDRFFTPKTNIMAELGHCLSPNASILLPGSDSFSNATTRWQVYREPNITVVVQVATESDVQETVSKHVIAQRP
jgi:hypothetical protein